jgi:Fe-Mn family superoxide dismutase
MKLKSLLVENILPDSIKRQANHMGINWDSDPEFLMFLKDLTDKDSIDKLTPDEIKLVYMELLSGKYGTKKSKAFFNPEPLQYGYGSLEAFINGETMQVHYEGHYMSYIKKLNAELYLLDKKPEKKIEDLISNVSKYSKTIKDNAGGYYNHNIFWQVINPAPQAPNTKVLNLIEASFKSIEAFKNKFEEKANSHFGSGWVWLVLDKKELKIVTTRNQDNPLMNDKNLKILLGLDLWEHSYYLKYKNKKDEYVKNFWNVACWCLANSIVK